MKGVKDLKRGDWVMHNGEPYRVERKEVVTVGTHCHSKTKLELISLHGKKDSILKKPGDAMEEIEIVRKRGQIISKKNKNLQLMDLISYETFEAEVDEDLFNQINEGDEVSFAEFSGKIMVLEKR